jgi:hypothetical protein
VDTPCFCTVQRPGNQAPTGRVRSVRTHSEVRVLPAGAAHDSAHAGEHLRLGRAARRRCAADAMFNLRKEVVHGPRHAADDTPGIQIALGFYFGRWLVITLIVHSGVCPVNQRRVDANEERSNSLPVR